jgi:hypothetical protein
MKSEMWIEFITKIKLANLERKKERKKLLSLLREVKYRYIYIYSICYV